MIGFKFHRERGDAESFVKEAESVLEPKGPIMPWAVNHASVNPPGMQIGTLVRTLVIYGEDAFGGVEDCDGGFLPL